MVRVDQRKLTHGRKGFLVNYSKTDAEQVVYIILEQTCLVESIFNGPGQLYVLCAPTRFSHD